jgi:membrane protein
MTIEKKLTLDSERLTGTADDPATRPQKGLVVLNPVAGKGQPDETRQTIAAALARVSFDVYETAGDEPLPEMVRNAVRQRAYRWVAAVGGDGTVSEVANGLVGSDVPLAIIPAGTGNVLAQELGIPQETEAAARLLLSSPDRHEIDGIEIDQRLFFLMVGVGVESEIMKKTTSEQKNRWGNLAYIVNAVKEAFGWQPFRFSLTIEGRTYELEASEVVLANTSRIGLGELALNDDIKLDDGRIDVAVIRARSIADYFRVVWAVIRRRPRQSKNMRFFATHDRLHLAMKRPLPVQGDGEALGERSELTATVVPRAVTVLVPSPEEAAAAGAQAAGEAAAGAVAAPQEKYTAVQNLRYLLTRTFREWSEDKASRLAAALSYYTVFSLPPLLVLSLAIAGLVYDRQAAQDQLLAQAGGLLGETGSEALVQILDNASDPAWGSIASIVSIALLFLGASGVFTQLQDAMNTIWEVKARPGRGILGTIKDRLLSFTMVLTVGFLLLVSLLLSTALVAVGEWVSGLAPDAVWLASIISFVISFGVISLLFALIFKTIPDVKIAWRDVWPGAVVTALLFNLGKWAIGAYLARSAPASAYGAAGSLIVVLLWVYYSAQILFLGAEFTQVYAGRFGKPIVADDNAVPLDPADMAQQGIPEGA